MEKHFFPGRLPMLCLCAAALSFTACSDDDEDGVVPNAGVIPTVADPITAIESPWGDTEHYVYDEQGRLVSGNSNYGSLSITFSPLTFTYVSTYDGYTERWDNVSTDTRGYMTRARLTYTEEDGYTTSGNIRLTYNADGYLSRIEGTGVDGGVTYTDAYTLEYEGGKLMRIVNDYRDPEYGSEQYTYTYTYAAAGENPNSGIPFYESIIDMSLPFIFLGGYAGPQPSELPVACREAYSGEDGDEASEYAYVFYYEWTYDAQGRVATFAETDENGYPNRSYTYHYGNDGTEAAPQAAAVRRAAVGTGVKKRPLSVRQRILAKRARLAR